MACCPAEAGFLLVLAFVLAAGAGVCAAALPITVGAVIMPTAIAAAIIVRNIGIPIRFGAALRRSQEKHSALQLSVKLRRAPVALPQSAA